LPDEAIKELNAIAGPSRTGGPSRSGIRPIRQGGQAGWTRETHVLSPSRTGAAL